ncbi:MAG: S1C family serine protease [Solirubrobacteraceae bacterium]
MRVRKRANRALILAGAALAVAAVAVALAVTGVFDGDEPATVEEIVARVGPSTALVVSRQDGEDLGNGSGWVLDAREGLVVTNHHVINGGDAFQVAIGRRMRPATVVGTAPCEDLAVLRVGDTGGLTALPLGSQGELRQGRTVVGFPANASLRSNLTSTAGVVSVTRSTYRAPALDVPRYPNVVQTDAAINPGNSGGPLVDLEGRLVGVNSAGFDTAGGRLIQDQGYAIGVDRVKQIVGQLREGRSLAWTGMGFDYPDRQQLRAAGLPAGLLVTGAVPGTPAARAGFDRGQSLLIAVNGTPISNTLQSYCRAVRDAGNSARFTVLDQGRAALRTVRLRLG